MKVIYSVARVGRRPNIRAVAEEDIPESAKVKPKEGEEAAPEQEKPKKVSGALTQSDTR